MSKIEKIIFAVGAVVLTAWFACETQSAWLTCGVAISSALMYYIFKDEPL